MTNFDNLKNMSIEEMATFLHTISNCEMNDCRKCPLYDVVCSSVKGIKEWLESEVTE